MSTDADTAQLEIASSLDVVTARQRGRALAQGLGMSLSDQTIVATAISEIARNIVAHAGRGSLSLSMITHPRPGIVVVARDHGPGIADVQLALQDGYSTQNSLGLGLPGARRLMDEFEIVSEPGGGTTVTMRKWAS